MNSSNGLLHEDTQMCLEQAKAYIYALDFTQIINKLIKVEKWLKEEALEICMQYRNFLYLNKKYFNEYSGLAPSRDIDNFWHNHILDTAKYRFDCQNIFGQYFDHYPYLGMDELTNERDAFNALELTQKLYYDEFGQYIFDVREDKVLHYVRKIKSLLNVKVTKSMNSGEGKLRGVI